MGSELEHLSDRESPAAPARSTAIGATQKRVVPRLGVRSLAPTDAIQTKMARGAQPPEAPTQTERGPTFHVGRAGDRAEREADRIADGVSAVRTTGAASADSLGGRPAPASVATRINRMQATGAAVDAAAGRIASRIGVDTGSLRIHRGVGADQLSRSLGASAFTVGTDVFFRSGTYDTSSEHGRHLVAHEFAHVRQHQRSQTDDSIHRHMAPIGKVRTDRRLTGAKQKWRWETYMSKAQLQRRDVVLKRIMLAANVPELEAVYRIKRVRYVMYDPDSGAPAPHPDVEGNPAKAMPDGTVYFNIGLADWYEDDGRANAEFIRSTIIHETIHAVAGPNHPVGASTADLGSATSAGLQEIDSLKPGDVRHSVDEAATERLALRLFDEVYGQDMTYISNYHVTVASKGVISDAAFQPLQPADAEKIPAAWTRDMVAIVETVLGLRPGGLDALYFGDHDRAKELIGKHRAEIHRRWGEHIDQEAAVRRENPFVTKAQFEKCARVAIAQVQQGWYSTTPPSADQLLGLVKAGLPLGLHPVADREKTKLLGWWSLVQSERSAAPTAPLPAMPAIADALGAGGLDFSLIERIKGELGIDDSGRTVADQLKVVLVPAVSGFSTGSLVRPVTVKWGDKLDTYPDNHLYNIPADFKAKNLAEILGAGDPKKPARAHLAEAYHGGGYEENGRLVLVSNNDPRTLLHEIGHYRQDLDYGSTESTVTTIILEYHNVVLHENRAREGGGIADNDYIRTRYGNTAGPSGKTWDDLLADAQSCGKPRDLVALSEIESGLGDARHAPLAATIKQNLVDEYFERKGTP